MAANRLRVCTRAELVDGELCAFTVRGLPHPVIVAIADGEPVAFPGVCPHEGIPLAEGYLFGTEVMCPGHAYTFDLRTGSCRHDRSLVLRRYPVTLVGDEIWIDV